ncbi:hypothetical protein BYT27DRAFT_6708363 [Phlegmacium glaucopus]|nr:hypothetical protein BYT27DRAFT_6708363 [Phlegmacium glaucopus]
MAKKTSKNQPKQANTANFGDAATISAITAPTNEKAPSYTTTVTTASPAHKTATARDIFCQFIEIADLKTIKKFLTTATSSPENENLEILWSRAYNEGYKQGVEESRSSKEKCYEMGVKDGKQEEQEDWMIEGHAPPLIPVPTTTSISVQTDVASAPLASSATIAIQTEPLVPIFEATSQNEPPFDEYKAKVNIHTSNDVFGKPATIYDDASTQMTSPTCQHLEIASPAPNDASQSPAMPKKEISACLGAKRERSSFVTVSRFTTPALAVSEPLAPHAIVSTPEAAEFAQKHLETSKTAVSTRFSWADDAETLPIVSTTPTKYPCDISGLHSSSTNAFLSLRRCHQKQTQNPRNSHHFNRF